MTILKNNLETSMISLQDFKVALGPAAQELSEQEILKLREQQDQMAILFFNSWLEKIGLKKYN